MWFEKGEYIVFQCVLVYLSSWSSKPDLVTVKLMMVTLIHTFRATDTHIHSESVNTSFTLHLNTHSSYMCPKDMAVISH